MTPLYSEAMGKRAKERAQEIKQYRQKSSDLFERQLVYIAGGAIAVCLGLLQAENSIISSRNIIAFQWALGGFIATLLINLFSHQTSVKSMDLELDKEDCKSDVWNEATKWLNRLSAISLIIGLVSIFITVVQIQMP